MKYRLTSTHCHQFKTVAEYTGRLREHHMAIESLISHLARKTSVTLALSLLSAYTLEAYLISAAYAS